MLLLSEVIILFLISLFLNIPMTRKPLSEDDGHWFYLSVFWRKGIRMFKGYHNFGYFGVPWISAKLYNIPGFKNLTFFYYLKAVWYSFNALSIYWLSYCFWHNHILSFTAGLIFAIITAVPNTLFVLTYAEHFFVLPLNLSIIFTYYGITTDNNWFFMLAGLTAAWSVQIKTPALLFSILLPISLYSTSNAITPLLFYASIFIGFNLLPLVLIRKYGRSAQLNYLVRTFGPLISFLGIILDKLRLGYLNRFIPENLILADDYIRNHYRINLQTQWLGFKRFMLPAIKDLYLILILASVQVSCLFVEFELLTFSMILLFVIFLLMQQAQKNYYTPHFNPCWSPISILAAKTVWDMWPYLFKSGVLGYTIIVFIVVELIKIGMIISKSFSKAERNIFGYLGPMIGTLFRLPESIGQYIQQNSKENEKLFVWGDQPSIYLYSKRKTFSNIDYLFVYAHQGRILKENEILDSMREKPPELLLFYNYKVNDGWNINRLQEVIGIPYKLLRSFKITDNQGRTIKDQNGIVFDFPLYQRDDEKYKEILLDRALIAKMNKDVNETRRQLENILEISPEDYEASIRLSLLKQNIAGSKTEQSYLEKKLVENHDSIKNSILLRLLAEINVDTGDLDSAVKNYEKALDSNLSDFRVHNGLGELSFSIGKIETALESFKKAIELHPYSSDVLNNIGVLLSQSGERDDAIKCFQKALSIMPTHPDARKNMEALT